MKQYEVGDTVDHKYNLVREIARGGGGIVYEAEHKFTTRRVAVKVLDEQVQGRTEPEYRLLREARALSVARHPNVVEVLDAGRDEEGGPYLVMELLEGRPVDGLLASRGKLSEHESLWLALQIALGAAKLHRHGLVHRDLKPSNVFVKYSQHGEEMVTLLDFGATTHEGLLPEQRITRDNSVIGTPEYMSPEQLKGEHHPDPKMDIYSVGVILYECLFGAVPYEGSYGQILLDVHTGKPRKFQSAEAGLSFELRRVLERTMALRAEERYHSAEELAADLLKLLPFHGEEGMSLLGMQSSGSDSSRPTTRRKNARAPYVTPLVLVLANGELCIGKTQDISMGGVLLFAHGDCSSSEVKKARFALPSSGEVVEVDVISRWQKAGRRGTVVGLEFESLNGQRAEDIQSYVVRMVSRSSGLGAPESATIRPCDPTSEVIQTAESVSQSA